MSTPAEVYPYRRTAKESAARDRERSRRFRIGQAIIPLTRELSAIELALGFLMGRAVLFNDLLPFGFAYYAARVAKTGSARIPLLLFVLAGQMTAGTGSLGFTALVLAATSLFSQVLDSAGRRTWLPFLLLGCVWLPGFLLNLMLGSDLYAYVHVFFEGALAAIITALLLLESPRRLEHKGTKSLIVLTAVLLGLMGIEPMGYRMAETAGIAAVLLAAYKGGAAQGALVGVVVGFLPQLAGEVNYLSAAGTALAGALAGSFKNQNRLAVLLSLTLGRTAIIIYDWNLAALNAVLSETIVAGAVFLLLPHKWIEALNWLDKTEERTSDTEQVTAIVRASLERIAAGLANLADFLQPEELKEENKPKAVDNFLKRLIGRVCGNCRSFEKCWEDNFYQTYSLILRSMKDQAMPELNFCIHRRELSTAVACLLEAHLAESNLEEKLIQDKKLVAEQLAETARIIREGLPFNPGDLEESRYQKYLASALDGQRTAPVVEAVVNGESGPQLLIRCRPCQGLKPCEHEILPRAALLMETDFFVDTCSCALKSGEKPDYCSFWLVPAISKVSLGIASQAKPGEKVSGDSWRAVQIPGGKYLLALSDGMGSGAKAFEDSERTVELLQKLLTAGYTLSTAIKTVNDVMGGLLEQERYVTLDVALVDLKTGQASVFKAGAAESYRITEKKVEKIKIPRLPLGVVPDEEVRLKTIQLNKNDLLLMVSDGVIDARIKEGDWLMRFLEAGFNNPEALANQLLDACRDGLPRDDLTILALAFGGAPEYNF